MGSTLRRRLRLVDLCMALHEWPMKLQDGESDCAELCRAESTVRHASVV